MSVDRNEFENHLHVRIDSTTRTLMTYGRNANRPLNRSQWNQLHRQVYRWVQAEGLCLDEGIPVAKFSNLTALLARIDVHPGDRTRW